MYRSTCLARIFVRFGDEFSIVSVHEAIEFWKHERRRCRNKGRFIIIMVSLIKTYDTTFAGLSRNSDLSGYKVITVIHYGSDRAWSSLKQPRPTFSMQQHDQLRGMFWRSDRTWYTNEIVVGGCGGMEARTTKDIKIHRGTPWRRTYWEYVHFADYFWNLSQEAVETFISSFRKSTFENFIIFYPHNVICSTLFTSLQELYWFFLYLEHKHFIEKMWYFFISTFGWLENCFYS